MGGGGGQPGVRTGAARGETRCERRAGAGARSPCRRASPAGCCEPATEGAKSRPGGRAGRHIAPITRSNAARGGRAHQGGSAAPRTPHQLQVGSQAGQLLLGAPQLRDDVARDAAQGGGGQAAGQGARLQQLLSDLRAWGGPGREAEVGANAYAVLGRGAPMLQGAICWFPGPARGMQWGARLAADGERCRLLPAASQLPASTCSSRASNAHISGVRCSTFSASSGTTGALSSTRTTCTPGRNSWCAAGRARDPTKDVLWHTAQRQWCSRIAGTCPPPPPRQQPSRGGCRAPAGARAGRPSAAACRARSCGCQRARLAPAAAPRCGHAPAGPPLAAPSRPTGCALQRGRANTRG